MPFVLPAFEVHGILRPLPLYRLKGGESGFLGWRGVDIPEIFAEFFLVLVGDILHRIADLMHNALLHVCMGKYRMDGIREASQAVNRGDENILDSAVFDFSEHAEPELCTLVFPDPQGDCSI